ncbi:TolC family protein [Denitratisoma sp. agr-D3]
MNRPTITLSRARFRLCCGALACALLLPAAQAEDKTAARYSLQQLTALALENNRGLHAAADQVDAARAGIDTARAFPNPELEALRGTQRARLPGTTEGDTKGVWVTQRLEYPWVRSARIDAADAGYDAARSEQQLTRNELLARLRYRFYELLRQEAELKAAREDQDTMGQIAKRIQLKVDSGESPRFEAIKADTELLNARKVAQSAELRIRQTRAVLRQLVGAALPAGFEVAGSLETPAPVPALDALRNELLERNPELARMRALTRQAESLRDHESRQRWPALALKGGYDQTPDNRDTRLGLVLTVPIWDWRGGPVAEATARLAKARNEEAFGEFTLLQNLETAWQQWQIATAQVGALESGIVKQAEAALKVAEAAYRYGERGILEYLDAQRVYRAARNELIAARFDQQVAAIEIDRLRAAPAEANTAVKGNAP